MREQAEQALKERCKSVQPTVVYCYVAPSSAGWSVVPARCAFIMQHMHYFSRTLCKEHVVTLLAM